MINLLAERAYRDIIGVAIVATLTIASDIRVSKADRSLERISSGVANDAILGGRDMIRGLSGSDITVVAGNTVVGDTRVAEDGSGKAGGTKMTVRAVLVVGRGRYVIDSFTGNDYVVMSVGAIRAHAEMIIGAGGKGSGGMTNLAILSGRHVIA